MGLGEMVKLLDVYGIGIVCIAVIILLLIFFVRKMFLSQDADRKAYEDERIRHAQLVKDSNDRNAKIQEEHNANQVSALLKVAESNNNVSTALDLIRDMFVDRTNNIVNTQALILSTVKTHCTDVSRIETVVAKIQESVLKTDERTKACVERSQSLRRGDAKI